MAVRNVSELRHRVTLLRPVGPAYDNDGFPVSPEGEWEAVRDVWALVRDVSGKEFFEAYTTQALDVTVVEMRAQAGIEVDNSWCVRYRGEMHYIVHINHRDYRERWWEIRTSRTRPERGDGVGG